MIAFYLPRQRLRMCRMMLELWFLRAGFAVWRAYIRAAHIQPTMEPPTGLRKWISDLLVRRQAQDSGVPAKVVETEWQWRIRGGKTEQIN